MSTTTAAAAPGRQVPLSPWAPLHNRVFAALFAAQLGSNIGSFFQAVAAAWLMGDLADSPTLVALVQTAMLLPILLFGLPAGALADIIDRRKLLLGAQTWMVTCAGMLAALTLLDLVTPAVLLALTFAMGAGASLMGPAWQAIQPDLVPPEEFSQAVALSSMTFNTGRAIGPALGGALVAAAGPGWAFALNAASFAGVIAVLVWWRPQRTVLRLPAETLSGAIRTGWRYGANSPAFHSVLVRTIAFAAPAAAIHGLLPAVVRDRMELGSGAYGLLLGCFGAGAVGAAMLRPRLDATLAADRLLIVSTAVMAGALAAIGTLTNVWLAVPVLLLAGAAWTTATVTTNVSAQRALPWWVRARGLGLYMVVLAGGIALGSALWGAIAGWSIPAAHLAAAATLALGTATTLRWRLGVVQGLDLRPAEPREPMVNLHPDPDDGPVLVTVHYRVMPERHAEFAAKMRVIERARRLTGADQWGLFRDLADTDLFVETFVVETWAEHLRQHNRRTVTADTHLRAVREFVEGDVCVAHLVSAYSESGLRPVADAASAASSESSSPS